MRTCSQRGTILMQQPSKRVKNYITVSNQTCSKYARVLKGTSSETKELNIHIKTHISHCLRVAQSLHQLDQIQIQIMKQYLVMPANFKSFTYLFFGQIIDEENKLSLKKQEDRQLKNDYPRKQIRKICLDFIKSKNFIQKIMSSSRMNIQNKIVLIKYLRNIEEKIKSDLKPIEGWKPQKILTVSK